MFDNEYVYPIAYSDVYGNSENPNLFGQVSFFSNNHGVRVYGVFHNLPQNENGFFGFHLHEGNECLPSDEPEFFEKAEGHYNPENEDHPKHAGDFPMLLATQKGFAEISFVTDRFMIQDIIGKAIIVHEGSDDYKSQPSGNAGDRIACGVIETLY